MFKLIQISDTHLSADGGASAAVWSAALRHVGQANADLVVHTGDIVRESPSNRDDHAFARCELDRLGVPWLAIPGNHDVGDGSPGPVSVTEDLLTQFIATYGRDWWLRDIPGWRLIGLNTMLFDTGLPAEVEQASWLEQVLLDAAPRQIALFMHKPPFILDPTEEQCGTATIPEAARAWFWPLIERHGARLILCGHRHEYRAIQQGGTTIVWAPTTSDLLDEQTPPFGPNRCRPGLIEHHFTTANVFHSVVDLGAAKGGEAHD